MTPLKNPPDLQDSYKYGFSAGVTYSIWNLLMDRIISLLPQARCEECLYLGLCFLDYADWAECSRVL